MRICSKYLISCLAALFYSVYVFSAVSNPALKIAHEKYKLNNGLEVILAHSSKSPYVTVDVWYHVGADVEVLGKTGFAHLFEHLMFQGTPHVGDDKHFSYLQSAGATMVNGSTNFDRTNYFETVPSNEVELALWLESDRMGWLMEGVTPEKLDNQRDVVKNERRQRTDNSPYGKVGEKAWQKLFDKSHPYYGAVIGSMADLDAASMQDVKEFFYKYYSPSNATLVISGDFNQVIIKEQIKKYFDKLPSGKKPEAPNVAMPELTQEIVMHEVEPLGKVPMLQIQYVTPGLYKEGDAAFDILSYVLTGNKTALLSKQLMYDTNLVQSISARQDSNGNASVFEITAKIPNKENIKTVQNIIDAGLRKIIKTPPSLEKLQEANAFLETQALFAMQSSLGIAEKLQSYNHFLKTPDGLAYDLERYKRLTPQDISSAAKTYLKQNARVVLIAVPK